MRMDSRIRSKPSDTCPFKWHILTQNVQGLKGGENLENTIKVMIIKVIHVYCMQETWPLRYFSIITRVHLLFNNGMKKETSQWGWASSVVAIILGPELLRAWTKAGKPFPITYATVSDFHLWMIGVTFLFPNWSNKKSEIYHRKVKGMIKLFLSSIYHPVGHDEKLC